MRSSKPKVPKKGAVKRLRQFSEKNRGKPSKELLEILQNSDEEAKDKRSAMPPSNRDVEI